MTGAGRLIAALAAASALLAPASTQATSLVDALARLAANHPAVRTEEERVNAADQRVRGTQAFFLPTVNLSSDYGYEYIDSPPRRATQGKPAKELRESVTLSITQNIFDGFGKNFDRRSAVEDKQAAVDTLENTLQGTLFQGASAYIEVLRQSELIQLVQANEVRFQRQFELENERVRAGTGLAVDLLLARQRLQLAKERRVIFNGSLQDSFSRYRQLFGQMPQVGSMETPAPPIDMLPTSLDEAIRMARRIHPLIASTNDQVDAARARQLAAQSDLFPRIDLVGLANFERDVNDVQGVRRDFSVLLQATWDLFTGFSIQSNIQATAFEHAANLSNLQFVHRQVIEEVRLAWQALQTSCERRFLLENALAIALEVLDSRRTLAAAGRETQLRVLDAETEVTNAQINLAAVAFDEMLSVYRMILATGRLEVDILREAAAFSKTEEATPSLVEWCREYANLDLRADDPFFQTLNEPGAPVQADPFAFGGDDLGAEAPPAEDPFAFEQNDAPAEENPFAPPLEADPFGFETEEDPFGFGDEDPFDDEAAPETDEGAGLVPLFEDDTRIGAAPDPLQNGAEADGAEEQASAPENVPPLDQGLSLAEDMSVAPPVDRRLEGQEFFDFDVDNEINRIRDTPR